MTSKRTILIIDGSYANIETKRKFGSDFSYIEFRRRLEHFYLNDTPLVDVWYFDHYQCAPHSKTALSPYLYRLKLAPPDGPQFQLKLYEMKKYQCNCPRCDNAFTQRIQKGVDIGIATKLLSLGYENAYDRVILFSGDGDFYDAVDLVQNVLKKETWILGARQSVSVDLQQVASQMIWLTELMTGGRTVVPPSVLTPNSKALMPSSQVSYPSLPSSSLSLPQTSLATTRQEEDELSQILQMSFQLETERVRISEQDELSRCMQLSVDAQAARDQERHTMDQEMALALHMSTQHTKDINNINHRANAQDARERQDMALALRLSTQQTTQTDVNDNHDTDAVDDTHNKTCIASSWGNSETPSEVTVHSTEDTQELATAMSEIDLDPNLWPSDCVLVTDDTSLPSNASRP